ncbi:hypothetical protein FZEAL_6135 [Fusarium zealandicum]|uniref:Uncharacterized protein n=1 Tax=Fusarium zealandicum TaxID=1053134 RepID=A0A8H4XJ42_9HYPO|nr:hypothetical protein FZEAL_6135 [Fusarium zealandicum]
MSSSRASTVTLGRDDLLRHREAPANHEMVPDPVNLSMLDEAGEAIPPKRLIIAVDFGTTYSAVSYVAVPQGYPPELVDFRSIRSIQDFPDCRNFIPSDQMVDEVPTEVLYPLNPRFRDMEGSNAVDQYGDNDFQDGTQAHTFESNFGISTERRVSPTGNMDIEALKDRFRWGYEVHGRWALPETYSNNANQPLSRFKLLLDNRPATEPLRQSLRETLRTLQTRKILEGSVRDAQVYVIADFLTHLLKHTKSQLQKEGFDESYRKEIVLCVPAIWTQKACRDMQTSMAIAMQRASFQGVDLQNNSIENLFIVSEPEAAAAKVLTENRGLNCGDVFVLLDAGGLYGSSYINEAFRTYLMELLDGETYLERENTTIQGIVEKIMMDDFEYRIKRTFDCFSQIGPKLFPVDGLKHKPSKNFRRGSIVVPREDINRMFLYCLEGIATIMETQITKAMRRGYEVKKVVLIGGFAASVSLKEYLKRRLDHFNRGNSSRISMLDHGENVLNAVASGAVLRALNKEQGPQREARSSYGILRTEPYKEYPEHEGLYPSYDPHDGQPYIMKTVEWVLKRGALVPPVWRSEDFLCSHTFDVWPIRPLICKEILYVSDSSTRSHYRLTHPNNQGKYHEPIHIAHGMLTLLITGAERVGEIVVDFSFLRDQGLIAPIEPTINDQGRKVGTRHYKVNYTMAIRVVDRDLECFASYGGQVRKRCRINIASGFRPGVK